MSIRVQVQVTNNSVPVNALADAPEITIRRVDTGAVVAGPSAMSDLGGGGGYTFLFTPTVRELAYFFDVDADPNVTGQVTAFERFYGGNFDDQIDEIFRDRGLANADPKTVDDNGIPDDVDIDEDVPANTGASIHKDVLTVGNVTTITRT